MLNLEILFIPTLFFVLFFPLVSEKNSIKFKHFIIPFIIFWGLFLRLYLALSSTGNYDMESFDIVSDLVLKGKNVYANTFRYNYSPLWFYILAGLKIVSNFGFLSFAFCERFFISMVDLVSLYLLVKIAKAKKWDYIKTGVLFFLNPVSIILSGHHGQFENLIVFFILLGIYIYLTKKDIIYGWLAVTTAGLLKHSVFLSVLIFLYTLLKSKVKIIGLFILSALIFLATFIPFVKQAKAAIINNVFLYRSTGVLGDYGIANLMQRLNFSDSALNFYRYFYYLLYLIFPLILPKKNLINNLLLGMLFFLGFAPGFALQYTVLPIALGALTIGPGFYIYTVITSFYLFGHGAELDILRFKTFWHHEVWYAVMFWFIWEVSKLKKLNMKK